MVQPKRNSFYFPRYSKFVFAGCLVIMAFFYHYHEILFMRPQSLHQWRQCDCLSITDNFYQENLSFFKPEIHNLSGAGNVSGKTISEFPVIYYFVAQLWKIFGQNEFIFRLLEMLIVFTGLFLLFRSLERILKDSFWSILIVLLIFTSPYFVFYTNNFIADTPAFGLSLTGWYFFFLFYEGKNNRNLIFSMTFFLLAALLKVSSAISVAAISGIFILELFTSLEFGKNSKLFTKPSIQWIPFAVLIFIVFSWYYYASWYNRQNGASFFLIGILPIWKLKVIAIKEILHTIRVMWIHQYFSIYTIGVFGIMVLAVLFFIKKLNRFFAAMILFLLAGSILFLLLWFKVLSHHDYYVLNLLILPVFVLLGFFLLLKENYPGIFDSVVFRILMVVFLCWNISYCSKNIHTRYWGWMNEKHIKFTSAFEDITPYLRSIGINRNDKVVSIPDVSFNVTLYLMDQPGWTTYGGGVTDSTSIADKIEKGAKYLFINNPKIYREGWANGYLVSKIGSYKNVDIWDLRGFKNESLLKQ